MSDPFETYELLCDSYIRYIQTIMALIVRKFREERDSYYVKKLVFQEPSFWNLYFLILPQARPSRLLWILKLPVALENFSQREV